VARPPAPRARLPGRAIAGWGGFLALLAAAPFLPLATWAVQFTTWARGAGLAGAAAFALAHVACALLLVPAWPLRVGAGFVYGPAWGFAVAAGSSFAGAMLAFVAGRRLLRARIERRIAREPRLVALDELVRGGGAWIVLLLRLSPLFPNELVNYGLGATRVRARDYALASLVGMLPLTAAYTWVGSLLTAVDDLARGRPLAGGAIGQVVWWGGLLATVAVAAGTGRLARRALGPDLRGAERPPRAAAVAVAAADAPPALAVDA
jgi:uncharacterized membrane protein YdjX (TVP38/TMEM64 family)